MKLDLPLLSDTPESWAPLAAGNLPIFLADHAICEQQAAMFGLTPANKAIQKDPPANFSTPTINIIPMDATIIFYLSGFQSLEIPAP